MFVLLSVTRFLYAQETALNQFLNDSSILHASVSVCIKDADSGENIIEYDSGRSLIPASVLKLITSGVALEFLGPQYYFRTIIGYTGSLKRRTGRLSGNIILQGGGDPALGSMYFEDHYRNFIDSCDAGIRRAG